MSHLRNLLTRSTKIEARPQQTVAAPAATPAPAKTSAHPDALTAVLPLPEFPVEEAHFTIENRLIFHSDPRSPAADRFRLLRMRLKEHWKAGKLKKLLITSPLAREGKSTIALNLATALTERGRSSVLIIEADLHQASLSQVLRLKQWAGLSECLVDETISPISAIRRVDPFGWHLLPAGEPRKNPTELLQSPAFGHIIQQAAQHFDWVLIDSPPVVPLTDSISLQQHADASLLVVRAGQTPREEVEQTITLLGKNKIVAIVLNGVQTRDRSYYQYYDSGQAND